MNLFQQYGIKEVADVMFYSINVIGDEEFYTPVLFLDTLKVSTTEQTAEKVSARGGIGNKKLISWNFGKDIVLNLEDALFSPASMSMIWGGKLNAKLSDYTSAIVKSNLANKYGKLHYSTKAYPSPALTDSEWELVFAQAQYYGIDSGSENESSAVYIKNGDNDQYVAENRVSFIKNYFRRLWEDITYVSLNNLQFFGDWSAVQPYNTTNDVDVANYIPTRIEFGDLTSVAFPDPAGLIVLNGGTMEEPAIDGPIKIYYKMGEVGTDPKTWGEEEAIPLSADLYIEYIKDDNDIASLSSPQGLYLRFHDNNGSAARTIWNKLFGNNDCIYSISPQVLFSRLFPADTSENEDSFIAMPQVVIDGIMNELTTIDKIGSIETDLSDIEVIDRWEKCIVKDRNGFVINTTNQKNNLFKYYSDNREESYTIYYDAKTMLPLFRTDENGIIDESTNVFTLKLGTVYYKWTRTVQKQSSDSSLGKTLIINADTFPGAYRITGETYIRNQKTGKDQRYQFVIYKASVSTDTNITLEAEGDPTTFSMSLEVLSPPNDILMELKEYSVEEDKAEGGTRIVPQKKKYSYTPTNIEYVQEIEESNDELY